MDLFVGKNCIPCKNLKAWLKESNIEVNQIVAEDNIDLAKEKGVRVLPTLVLDDNSIVKGADNIKEYFENKE